MSLAAALDWAEINEGVPTMKYEEPRFPKGRVIRAGKVLIDEGISAGNVPLPVESS